jgi:hypothetical protein
MSIEIQTARRRVLAIVSLAAAYFLAGKFGLSLANGTPQRLSGLAPRVGSHWRHFFFGAIDFGREFSSELF